MSDQHIISVSTLATMAGDPSYQSTDYMVARLRPSSNASGLPRSFKIDALSIFLFLNAPVEFSVNFKPVALSAGDLLVLNPASSITLPDSAVAPEGYALFLSRELLNLISIDNSVIDYTNMHFAEPSALHLSSDQMTLLVDYIKLLTNSRSVNPTVNVYTRNIDRSIISAFIYQLMNFVGTDDVDTHQDARTGSRRNYYIKDFMQLLGKHFRTERSINFYAEKLFISSKYLSLIIKEATGRTATEWIDSFVVLEAKNLLRYSGRNIQQIAYDLNFHNQSSFGKYFKHHTGMSPSDFRKS